MSISKETRSGAQPKSFCARAEETRTAATQAQSDDDDNRIVDGVGRRALIWKENEMKGSLVRRRKRDNTDQTDPCGRRVAYHIR